MISHPGQANNLAFLQADIFQPFFARQSCRTFLRARAQMAEDFRKLFFFRVWILGFTSNILSIIPVTPYRPLNFGAPDSCPGDPPLSPALESTPSFQILT